jgi:hypothetical protein
MLFGPTSSLCLVGRKGEMGAINPNFAPLTGAHVTLPCSTSTLLFHPASLPLSLPSISSAFLPPPSFRASHPLILLLTSRRASQPVASHPFAFSFCFTLPDWTPPCLAFHLAASLLTHLPCPLAFLLTFMLSQTHCVALLNSGFSPFCLASHLVPRFHPHALLLTLRDSTISYLAFSRC